MRELKFRAWDGVVMSVPFGLLNNEGGGSILWPSFPKKEPRDWEYMQFTGLLDKNGKEIYEGDIWRGNEGRGVIEWNGNGYSNRDEDGAWWMPYDLEIIGNIWQNPELLPPPEARNGG